MQNPLHETIAQMEDTMRKLKNQYDLFFAGVLKLPPSEEHKRFVRALRELSKDKIRDNTARFRLNNLLNKYTLFQEMWNRRMREVEEGPLQYKRRMAAFGNVVPADASEREVPDAPVTSPAGNSYVKVGPGSNGTAIRELHQRILDAQQGVGGGRISLEQVSMMVDRQLHALRDRFGAATIGFRVEVVEGKVKLKAKPFQDR